MTPQPPNFAQTPRPDDPDPAATPGHERPDAQDAAPDTPADALSEILQAIHLRGGPVVHGTSADLPAAAHRAGTRAVHLVEHGSLDLVTLSGAARCQLDAGDMVLVPRGDAHRLQGRESASWVTGRFSVEEAVAEPLLAVLPPLIVVRRGEQDEAWLQVSLDLLLVEMSGQRPGAQVMISRILDLLFIHALRAWAESGVTSPGWLTAAMDPALGPVLSAVHRSPAHPWSVDELAARANLSRSAFAGRFTRLLGATPAAYVTERRLLRAATLLESTTDPVGEIARHVGYQSEAAFSRAFRRRYGTSPRRWRRSLLIR